MRRRLFWLLAWVALALSGVASASAIDLRDAAVERLDNGLTLIVLEDPTFPVVSVQMLYKVGARDEKVGRTGLAHYLEHMAFRATEDFPETGVVSSIYAVGGEWHGYTWIDQTTYFETVPQEHLDLVLRIEADRMGRLLIPGAEVEAERGAVLAELHGYENDPASVLKDTVVASSFLQHPYRYNTIGWESDVGAIEHADLVRFYQQHYQPANAVLAVVGSVSTDPIRERVHELFGGFEARPPSAGPRTVEPPQRGERRVRLLGAGERSYLDVAYRAPSVRHPDWPAFLLLQEVLAGGEGVNFSQSEWGVPVREGARLAGVIEGLVSWYPPTFDPYVFTLSASVAPGSDRASIEAALEREIERLRDEPVSQQELEVARSRLLAELVFDVQTTEDAAHQLAFFAGLDALPLLLSLPKRLERLQPADLLRVARSYLQPHQRTVGWFLAGPAPSLVETALTPPSEQSAHAVAPRIRGQRPSPSPRSVTYLESGLPFIFQRVTFSPTAYLRVVVPTTSTTFAAEAATDEPAWRHTSLDFRFLPGELDAVLAKAERALRQGNAGEAPASPPEDPGGHLALLLDELVGLPRTPVSTSPAVIVLVGDLEVDEAGALVRRRLGHLQPGRPAASPPTGLVQRERVVTVPAGKAQAQLGYVVLAPPARHPDAWAWRMLLYILSHGYEGRLGREAISQRGLVYYIDARYRSDGASGVVTLSMGVDPPKLMALRRLLEEQLEELHRRPPTATELAEAKQHILGRRRSAAQSNEEISAALAAEWIGQGRLLSEDELAGAVDRVRRQDLLRILPSFTAGAVAVVEVEP